MKALLIVATVLGLGTLAACGQRAEAPAGSSAGSQTTESEQTLATPAEPPHTPVPLPETKPGVPADTKPVPPVTIGPDGPVVPAGVTPVPPAQVDAKALPEHYEYRGMVWVFDGGYSLQMFAAATSGCGAVNAKLLDQSDPVRIELQPLDQPQGGPPDGEMCTQVITPTAVTVRLSAPLGNRTVVLTATP